MSARMSVLACLALALCGRAVAEEPVDEKLINKLMQREVLIPVMQVDHPEAIVEDNDPNTMQIVFMTDPNAKPRVSDDGEIVYLPPGISITDQAYLTHEAFRRKAKRVLAGQIPAP
jgi:hypothetical protein